MNFSLGGGDNQPNGRPAPLSEEEEAAAAESAARGANNREETRPISGVGTTGFMGKHRMTAAVNFLDQQIQIIQVSFLLLLYISFPPIFFFYFRLKVEFELRF